MTSKRIETGTPEGDAMGFYKHLFRDGWRPGMITGSICITSSHGTGMKEIPRPFSGNGFCTAMMSV